MKFHRLPILSLEKRIKKEEKRKSINHESNNIFTYLISYNTPQRSFKKKKIDGRELRFFTLPFFKIVKIN